MDLVSHQSLTGFAPVQSLGPQKSDVYETINMEKKHSALWDQSRFQQPKPEPLQTVIK